jgi:hypothetical protein
MIGKDNPNEEVVIKVNDRRKFNLDGSLREGIVIERQEEKKATDSQSSVKPQDTAKSESREVDTNKEDKPTVFMNFLSTIVTNIATVLGIAPHPITGQKMVDLDAGKYWIDVLAMLKEKTKGNLDPDEEEMLDQLLAESRMQYVQMMRLTEEKLKAQAAKKFSAKDVLGKKF